METQKLVKVLPVSFYTGTGKYYVDYELEVKNRYDVITHYITTFKSFYSKEEAVKYGQQLTKKLS